MLLIKHCIADSRAVFGAGANPAAVAHGSLVNTGRAGQVHCLLAGWTIPCRVIMSNDFVGSNIELWIRPHIELWETYS
jgi:hypothetical protein